MENATNYGPSGDHSGDPARDLGVDDSDVWELDDWLEITNAEQAQAKLNRRPKKRRKPLRKNRKPSRPANYIGQRTNNHLLKMFTDRGKE